MRNRSIYILYFIVSVMVIAFSVWDLLSNFEVYSSYEDNVWNPAAEIAGPLIGLKIVAVIFFFITAVFSYKKIIEFRNAKNK